MHLHPDNKYKKINDPRQVPPQQVTTDKQSSGTNGLLVNFDLIWNAFNFSSAERLNWLSILRTGLYNSIPFITRHTTYLTTQ